MTDFTLVVANKNYSSWSLRAWLMLKQAGAEFEHVVVPLRQTATKAEILRHSPSGKLPALRHGDLVIWESLAIGEYLHDIFPKAKLWPKNIGACAVARSVSAEMHSGFQAFRGHFPMNMRSSFPNRGVTPEVQSDINRITALWHDCRKRFGKGGDFLFGGPTIADAMYAPVVSRFLTYKVELDEEAHAYCDAISAVPAFQEWYAAARNEPMIIEEFEF